MIFEDPKDLGIWIRFNDAVKVLCTEPGLLNKKLYRAYYDCGIVHLSGKRFKDSYISKQLKCIEEIVDKGYPRFNLPKGVFMSIDKLYLHWRTAAKMAKAIFDIYEYLTKLRMNFT